ncbi:hypothetical protein [Sulfoacidibacillus thermotolerans]|uniref:Cell division protein FtsL n=1 Tax=Sulfoacidibacillus thermotolerans TaxID=1765684 RepID=A0A2U3D8W1_SULT2|nr:hypothetical protein [Sulfoacidibacillus thermotolerans]PWI57709.1 hypothetical protein BM613_06900 [Sulfoacidibacillus thermotolerans]
MIASNPIRNTAPSPKTVAHQTMNDTLRQQKSIKMPHQAAHPQTRDRLGLIVSLFFCAGIAIFLVGQYANLIVTNYQIASLKVTLSHEVARDAALRSTVYELASPTRVLHIAEHVLHMQPATPVEVGTISH